MQRNLFQRLSIAVIAISLGAINLWMNPSAKFSSNYLLAVGIIIFIVTIAIYLRKLEKEDDLSKEFDERDAYIEGQASNITMHFIVLLIIILMFMSNFIMLSGKTILAILSVALLILNTVTKFFYERVL
ncbi:DUF2178 domain-containing protein [Lysinibacillus xylanilyticus]|uniref:DUF2178 domain-containing protein n=1 Tax=Lysinibacillus xylanilyticus TaxID=582475 RepID=UPI002B23FDC3|nr:DUF2178 domain-containing protein [Lysinibacillus xylanilyticus]MEB2301699.1 DUF2178 domain-containing protein [Lysinibacillus xylanilyticus]